MHRVVAGITTLEQHLEMLSSQPEIYRPPYCPRCGFKILGEHDSYWRKADRRATRPLLNPVPICRYRCTDCRRTCSRLPECIAPRRWYDWSVQQEALANRLDQRPASECRPGNGPAVRTVVRWWIWLQKRSATFASCLRARFPDLGRESEFPPIFGAIFVQHLLNVKETTIMVLNHVVNWASESDFREVWS